LWQHRRVKKSNSNTKKIAWIKYCYRKNREIDMKILAICSLDEYEKYETFFIKKYQDIKLTNSDETGQGNKNRKRKIINKAIKKISKTVYQYDLEGNFITEYNSTREAGKKLGIYHSHIVRCCNGVIKHTTQFIFRYEKTHFVEKIDKPNAVKKKIVELDSNGNIINKWDSLMDCSREQKLDNGNLSKVCNGITKSYKKRFFRFV